MGNLLCVIVHAANIHDTVAGGEVILRVLPKYPSIKGAGAGYRKTFKEYAEKLGLKADISERIKPEWEILPKRWRVERTLDEWFSPSV